MSDTPAENYKWVGISKEGGIIASSEEDIRAFLEYRKQIREEAVRGFIEFKQEKRREREEMNKRTAGLIPAKTEKQYADQYLAGLDTPRGEMTPKERFEEKFAGEYYDTYYSDDVLMIEEYTAVDDIWQWHKQEIMRVFDEIWEMSKALYDPSIEDNQTAMDNYEALKKINEYCANKIKERYRE